MLKGIVGSLLGILIVGTAQAQPLADPPVEPAAEVEERDGWDYGSEAPVKFDPQMIIRQKAMVRSEQRAQRIAALNWYGMSNSRPTACPTPLMGTYSPVWQMPGGRPFAWFPTTRPMFIIR